MVGSIRFRVTILAKAKGVSSIIFLNVIAQDINPVAAYVDDNFKK